MNEIKICVFSLTVTLEIAKLNLLPPLVVVQTLAQRSSATLGVVRNYVMQRIAREEEVLRENERLVMQYRQETERMRKEIDLLKTRQGDDVLYFLMQLNLFRFKANIMFI